MSNKCSFCGKPKEEVKCLVNGPEASICSDCTFLCMKIFIYEFKDYVIDFELIKVPANKHTGKKDVEKETPIA